MKGGRRKTRRRKRRRKARKQRGGVVYAGFSIGDKVRLSPAGLARMQAGPPFPGWSQYNNLPAAHIANAANWRGSVIAITNNRVGGLAGVIPQKGRVQVDWHIPGWHFLIDYRDYDDTPAGLHAAAIAAPNRGGEVSDIVHEPNALQPGGSRKASRKRKRKGRRRTRRRKGRRTRQKKRRKKTRKWCYF